MVRDRDRRESLRSARPARGDPAQPTHLSRRNALTLGGVLALAPVFAWATPALAGEPSPTAEQVGQRFGLSLPRERRRRFDADWRFYRGALIGAEVPDFDDTGWRRVDTPHDWRIEDLPNPTATDSISTADPTAWLVPTTFPDRIGPFDVTATAAGRSESWTVGGEGWYRKAFRLSGLRSNDLAEVHFDGVYHNSDVWLNGHHLGFQPYGYSPFSYDLTPYLVNGENVLAVRVRTIGSTSRWYPGAGIFRNVTLITTGPVRIPIDGIWASAHDVSKNSATVSVQSSVVNGGSAAIKTQVRVTLLDRHGRSAASQLTQPISIEPGATVTARADLIVRRPDLWSIEEPNLYRVRAEVVTRAGVVDRSEVTTGIRSISMTGQYGFLLNGREVKMRGANIHHDNGALGAVAAPDAEDRKVRLLKESGFNAIRTSHNPPSAALLDACDRHGVVVIDELFDRWDVGGADTYAVYFDEWWTRIVDRVITRDRNHPSIVMWSTGNEIGRPPATGGQNPSVAKYGKVIADRVRSLDPNRPVTQGSAMGQAFFFTLASTAPDWDYLDLADAHYQNDLATTYHNSVLPLHDGHPDRPLVIGEAWHQEIYDDWKSVIDHPWAIGTFSWTGWDYLGESGAGVPRLFPVGAPQPPISLPALPYPWISSYQGDHDLIGQPKPQLYWKRVVWGLSDLEMAVERPAPDGFEQRALVWSYYDELQSWTWPGREGKDMKVRVYTTGDEVRLFLGGREVARKAVTDADKRVTTFVLPYAPGRLTATARRRGREIGRKSFDTAGTPAGLRLTTDDRGIAGEPGSLAHVLVEVVDDHNRQVPDAVALVSVAVRGPATLAGIGSANPHYVDSFQQPRRYTYHGQALAILRATGDRGTVTLTASAPGLRSTDVRLRVG